MFLKVKTNASSRGARHAFTLTEVLVSLAVSSFVFVSLFAGITQGTNSLQMAREKLRATQILTEKLEVIRLYNWDQVNTPGFIPQTFTEYQYPAKKQNQDYQDYQRYVKQGIAFSGTVKLGPADVHPAYTNTMRKIVAEVTWKTGTVTNRQTMETFISEFGVQKYVY